MRRSHRDRHHTTAFERDKSPRGNDNDTLWAILGHPDKTPVVARESLSCDVCAVRDRGACSALDTANRKELAKLGHHRRLKRGETLFVAGDRNALSATLISGVLKVSGFDKGGTEHIVSLIHSAGFVGELFTPTAHHDIIALTDSDLCVFERAEYERALEHFPELGHALFRRSSNELMESRLLLASVAGRSARQRLAGFLLAVGRAASDSECYPAREFDLVLTRGEIASLLGLTIETISRQLTKLEKERVIQRQGARGIIVEDAARLSTIAG